MVKPGLVAGKLSAAVRYILGLKNYKLCVGFQQSGIELVPFERYSGFFPISIVVTNSTMGGLTIKDEGLGRPINKLSYIRQ